MSKIKKELVHRIGKINIRKIKQLARQTFVEAKNYEICNYWHWLTVHENEFKID